MSEQLPDADERGRLLLTEAAEGGAGVLRRLQSDATALPDAAREALRILHVDPETGLDADDACGAGCYKCLLSYSNQMDHERIDRRTVVPLLRDLGSSRVQSDDTEPVTPPTALADDFAAESSEASLLATPEAERAAAFLRHLEFRGLRLPSHGEGEVGGLLVDFVYDSPLAVVVVHDDMMKVDASDLTFDGYQVVTVGLDRDFDDVIREHPSVFGEAVQ